MLCIPIPRLQVQGLWFKVFKGLGFRACKVYEVREP